MHPFGSRVYAANGTNVSVIDTATNTVVATVVGVAPFGVAAHPFGGHVYVTEPFEDTVSVIETATNTVVATVEVGVRPFGVAVTPDGGSVYVVNGDPAVPGTLSVIDTATNTVVGTVHINDADPVAFGQFIGGPLPPVGGSITGLDLEGFRCWNKTTRQRFVMAIPEGETTWDCEAEGLIVDPGDTVQITGQGVAE